MPAIDRHKPLKRLKRGVQISSYRLSVSFFFLLVLCYVPIMHNQYLERKLASGIWLVGGGLQGGKQVYVTCRFHPVPWSVTDTGIALFETHWMRTLSMIIALKQVWSWLTNGSLLVWPLLVAFVDWWWSFSNGSACTIQHKNVQRTRAW